MNLSLASLAPLSKPTLRFGLLALVLAVAASASSLASAPLAIKIVSGAYQHTPYGSNFGSPLVVEVTDPKTKLGIAGVLVEFTPGTGIGLSKSSVITDSNGKVSVIASGAAAGTYSVGVQAGGTSTASFANLVVSKVPLTILPASLQSITGLIPTLSRYSLSGFVNGETAESARVTGTPVLTTVATGKSGAGNFAIKGTAGSLAAPNYSFAPGSGTLSLTAVPVCGNLGAQTSSLLHGTYAFNLYDQQGGFTGVMTADGADKLEGHAYSNRIGTVLPTPSTFIGAYRIGNGNRGGAVLLHTLFGNATTTQINTFCFAVDTISGGVATRGRLIASSGYKSAEAGTFYLSDASATSVASFSGNYVVGLQGTRLDTTTGNPLPMAEVAWLHLNGNGRIIGSLADVDAMVSKNNQVSEHFSEDQQLSGTYTFDPADNTGTITINNGANISHLTFTAASSKHLLLMTQDAGVTASPSGSTSVPVYFGEANRQASGHFSAASFSGNLNFVAQGVDAYSALVKPAAQSAEAAQGLAEVQGETAFDVPADTLTAAEAQVTQVGGMSADGQGTMTNRGWFTMVDGAHANTQNMTGTGNTFAYTVSPANGRFESRDPKTKACTLCGYLIAPNQLIALAPGSGMPLYVTLNPVTSAPTAIKVSTLVGKYSLGSKALISPLSAAYDGIITFDGKGNSRGAIDVHSVPYGQINNYNFSGTYTASEGAYLLTMEGGTGPDFLLYMDSNTSGTLVPYSARELGFVPLITVNAVKGPAAN